MRGISKRLGAWLLTLALLVGAMPDWEFPTARAASDVEEPTTLPFDASTVGAYLPATIGKGALAATVMNATVSKDVVTYAPGNVTGQIKVSATKDEDADRLQNVKFVDGFDSSNMPQNVDDYNMWRNFGVIDNGALKTAPTAGFSTDNAEYVNSSTPNGDGGNYGFSDYALSLGPLGKKTDTADWSATITISENPTLKALAESGKLQFRFSALNAGALSGGGNSLTTIPACTVTVSNEAVGNISTGAIRFELLGLGYDLMTGTATDWTTVKPDDVIKFTVSLSKPKAQGSRVGLADAVLLFRVEADNDKDSVPKIESFTMEAAGDYRVSDTGRNQVLLGGGGAMDLTVGFTSPVKPALEGFTNPAEDTYAFMSQFCKHALFTNLNSTGFYRAGEKANLTLTKVNGKEVSGLDAQLAALNADDGVKTLTFHWDGATDYGDYYGNNPVPNGGDWISLKSGDLANNNYGFWNKLLLASWHDDAGNPLCDADGNPYKIQPKTSDSASGYALTKAGKLSEDFMNASLIAKGKFEIKRGSTVEKAPDLSELNGNPFAYDFIIDTVPPTYSVTSNGVQPDILTNLALNRNDEYDLTVNFSEGVQVKRFTDTGALTGYQNGNVCLEFAENSGMRATYVSGGGTKNWVFHAIVQDGAAYETDAMELAKIVYQGANPSVVLTDYVGNPLQKASETSETPSIAWAKLKVDNTAPEITIAREGQRKFLIGASDSGSGVFVPPADDGSGAPGGSDKAVIFYAWVEKDKQDAAIAALTANNYAAIKRYSLTGQSPDACQLSMASISGGKSASVELDANAKDAEWVLLVFESDMTWDGARQLIQYGKYKSYKNTESGAKEYYEKFMELYGGAGSASGAVDYKALTSKPADWETKYYNYYASSGSSYQQIPQADSYPEFVAGRVYQPGYALLESDPTANDQNTTWNDVYLNYYVKNGDVYERPAVVPAYPAFEQNKYYAQYLLVTDETAPSDWMTATSYYALDDEGNYQQVKQNQPPEFDGSATFDVTFTAATLSTPVTDDTLAAGEYYVLRDASTYERVFKTEDGATYYTATPTAVTTQPGDWTNNYGNYYVKVGEQYAPVSAESAPAWEAGKYYSAQLEGETVTYAPLTAQPEGWATNYTTYYVLSAQESYQHPSAVNVEYASGLFYKKTDDPSGYKPLTDQPNDWTTSYTTRYYVKDGNSYKLIPENVAVFETGKYYKAAYLPVASAPSDWSQTAASGKYCWYVGALSVAESERTEFVTLLNLPKRMLGLCDVTNGSVATTESDSTVRLVSAPAFVSGSYYEATLSVDGLLESFTDTARRQEFLDAITNASTNVDKMRIISAYSEFAETLGAVDRKLMQQSGKYENWSVSDYQKDDSNWSYKTSDAVESKKPVISLAAEGVENDNSSNVTVRVKISEDTGLQDKTQYKFVTKGTQVPETDEELWKGIALSGMTESAVEGGKEYAFALSTGDFSASLENGSYDLYVKATDVSENAALTKVATVTIDRSAEIYYALLLTEDASDTAIAGTGAEEVNMTASPRKSADLSVKFAGKIDGGDLFDVGNFKLYWAVDANATKTDSNGWTELSNGEAVSDSAKKLNGRATKLYKIGEIKEKTGLYYLHLRYAYTRNGEETTQYLNKGFALNATAPVITFNVLSSTNTEAEVQVTVSPSAGISAEYVWISGRYEEGADISGAVSGVSWKGLVLPGQASLKSTDDIAKKDSGNVTLVVKAKDSLGNEATQFQSFLIEGEQPPVPAPNPTVSLLDVQQLADGYYAVVKLDMPQGQIPDVGSSYSVALVKNGAEGAWARWTPYESMIRVKVCQSASDLGAAQLRFKFMSSTGAVTAPANYVAVGGFAYPFTSTQPWAAVSRSTLQPVSMDKGVALRFILKMGAAVTAATDLPENALTSTVDSAEGYTTTVKQSGLYVYNVTQDQTTLPLYVAVNNIPPKTAPSWKMSFSTLETSSNPVTATLTIDEGVSVDKVIFQADPVTIKENGETKTAEFEPETAPAMKSYLFQRNGTAYFTLSNVSGGTTTAKAVVNWIDGEAPDVTITPDYGAYRTITDGAGAVKLAGGVKLVLSANEVINIYMTSAQYENAGDQYGVGQSFTFNAPQNQEYRFHYRDQYGNSATASYQVGNLVAALPAPDVEIGEPGVDNRVTVTIRGQIPEVARGVSGYKLYAGITTNGNEIAVAPDGSYTYSESVTTNGYMKRYICDNLNNTAFYEVSVASIDLRAPVVEMKDTAWITQGDRVEDINWWDYVTATDNVTPADKLKLSAALESGASVDTSVAGSHRVRVTVTDEAGNAGYADVFLYVMPADGMLITDQNGVLFYSQSNDVSLVNNDRIQMTVSRYQMMRYGKNQETVTNADMTFDIYIQKGIYREGQLKYIQTVTFKEQGGESSQTVKIEPKDLDGAGWYTIIVRNSEREREFTTFFINASVLK